MYFRFTPPFTQHLFLCAAHLSPRFSSFFLLPAPVKGWAERREARIFLALARRSSPRLRGAVRTGTRSGCARLTALQPGAPRLRGLGLQVSALPICPPATATGTKPSACCAPGRNLRASDTGLLRGGRAACRGRHPRSAFRIASGDAPSMSEDVAASTTIPPCSQQNYFIL